MILNCGAGEDSMESPLDYKEIKLVNPEENQPWIFFGKTVAEAETPVLWPTDVNNWLLRKDPDARKDWRQEEKVTIEDERAGWHPWLNGHEFEQALGVDLEQGSLAFCSWWNHKESNMTVRLNWIYIYIHANFSICPPSPFPTVSTSHFLHLYLHV